MKAHIDNCGILNLASAGYVSLVSDEEEVQGRRKSCDICVRVSNPAIHS